MSTLSLDLIHGLIKEYWGEQALFRGTTGTGFSSNGTLSVQCL